MQCVRVMRNYPQLDQHAALTRGALSVIIIYYRSNIRAKLPSAVIAIIYKHIYMHETMVITAMLYIFHWQCSNAVRNIYAQTEKTL